ncbi:hypothetical protein DAEQUDRAFT_258832 [Daedalea quercina L-15889]|uniref:Uncharacterized protein n=1 Tax=Daedalea quercina L-15889 TaxID=1314783 RepID=A0A165QKD7_9APHY|nr:hypothetical protein DAEQUDRAFT_258832 [Daedalea quercina L-15889]
MGVHSPFNLPVGAPEPTDTLPSLPGESVLNAPLCEYGNTDIASVESRPSPLLSAFDDGTLLYSCPNECPPNIASPISPCQWLVESPVELSPGAPCNGDSITAAPVLPAPPPVGTLTAPSPECSRERENRALRRRAVRHPRLHSSPSTPAPSSLASSLRTVCIRTTSPRNKQVGFEPSAEFDTHNGCFACPYCELDDRYSTHRKVDMDRHIKSHFTLSRGHMWVCCGVPEESCPGHDGKDYEYAGKRMFGGCLKAFSRKGSFLRHLKLRASRCLRPVDL